MKKPYLKYHAGLLLFGSNGVIASYIHLSSYEIVLLRSVLGIALLLGLFLITGHRFTAFRQKKDLLFLALSGIAMAAAAGINAQGLLCAGLSAVAYAVMVLSNKMAKEITGTENATIQLFCTAVVVCADSA